MQKRIITLTTDFGLKDPFVGIMKGVIMGINPDVCVIDISHNIAPHNIFEASQIVLMSYRYFPRDTIHVVVVDPGVGSTRRPVLVITDDYYFIGPDNGVFTPIYEDTASGSLRVIRISSTHYFMPEQSTTFHGRDIFAPVAAWLSKGIEASRFGEEITDYIKTPLVKPSISDEGIIKGNVIAIDVFGNAITNIKREDIDRLYGGITKERIRIQYRDRIVNLVDYYADTEKTTLSALFNSFGNLELFVFMDSASRIFNIHVGDTLTITQVN